MIKVFVRDTATNEVLMDKELDGLYLVGTEEKDGGNFEASRIMVGRNKPAKAALYIGVYNVPRSMLETLMDFAPPRKIEDDKKIEDETEDNRAFREAFDSLARIVRWVNEQKREDD